MADKYSKSFEEEIPQKCPICGYEFDLQEDTDIEAYEDGVRTMLYCAKCSYKKVISYTTYKDIEEEQKE